MLMRAGLVMARSMPAALHLGSTPHIQRERKAKQVSSKKPEISHIERRAVAAGGGRVGHPARCGVHLVVRRWRRVHGQVRARPRWEAAVQDRHPASQEN